jgi:hypothetical protein
MVTQITKWICIAALLLIVTWRPSANYQLPFDFVVCAGAVMVVLASFFIKRGMEIHYDLDRSTPRGESL